MGIWEGSKESLRSGKGAVNGSSPVHGTPKKHIGLWGTSWPPTGTLKRLVKIGNVAPGLVELDLNRLTLKLILVVPTLK